MQNDAAACHDVVLDVRIQREVQVRLACRWKVSGIWRTRAVIEEVGAFAGDKGRDAYDFDLRDLAPRARFELATLRLTAGGCKTLNALFGVAYDPEHLKS